MKRSIKLYVLLGVLIVACVVTVLVTRRQEKKEEIKASGEVVLTVPADNVTAIRWDYGGETLSFHRGDGWTYDADAAFPVDESKLTKLFNVFESFAAAFTIENVEDYGQYGLDQPICTIDVTTETSTVQMKLGDYSKLDSQRYVSVGDGKVYLAKSDPLDVFDATLSDLIRHDEIPAMDTVTEICFSGAEDYTVTRVEDDSTLSPCADDVYFADLSSQPLALDSYAVESWLSAVESLSPTDYVTYNATDEELASFGMDAPELTATVTYTAESADEAAEPEQITLYVSRNREELAATEDSEDGDTSTVTAYVRIGQSPIVYRVTQYKYSSLMSMTRDELRHQTLWTADLAQATGMEIRLEGEAYSFISETNEDGALVWHYGEQEIDLGAVSSALKALTAERFVTETPEQKAEIGLTISLENESFPQIELTLYRYDGADCLAQVNGATVSLIPRAQVVNLIEAVNAIVLNGT